MIFDKDLHFRRSYSGDSPEYSCGKKTPLYPIRAASFVSIVLYLIHVIGVYVLYMFAVSLHDDGYSRNSFVLLYYCTTYYIKKCLLITTSELVNIYDLLRR